MIHTLKIRFLFKSFGVSLCHKSKCVELMQCLSEVDVEIYQNTRQASGPALKAPCGTPTSQIAVPGFNSWFHFQLHDNVDPRRHQLVAQVVEFL